MSFSLLQYQVLWLSLCSRKLTESATEESVFWLRDQ